MQSNLFDALEDGTKSECNSTPNTKSEKIGQRHISIEWLAGFIDGEGCFNYYMRSTPGLKINSANYDILCRIKEQYGGAIYDHSRGSNTARQSWTWNISGNEAKDLILKLLPYLIEKQNQAVAILGHQPGDKGRNQVIADYLKDQKKTAYTHLIGETNETTRRR